MPVLNNLVEKFFMGTLNLAPAPMLDIMGGFTFYAVTSAVQLNLFEALDGKDMTTGELARVVGCDDRGLDILMELLETLGYVRLRKSRYVLAPMTEKWMLKSSGINFSDGFLYYHRTMTDLWPYITESMKQGRANINFYEWLKDNPGTAVSYQRFMMSLASLIIPELVHKLRLSHESVLDIGGSHGLYSIALCRINPGIKVTIIDSEYAMPLLKKNIHEAGMEDRITPVTGNFMDYGFNEKFNTILLFNVLHEHTEQYNRELLAAIHGTLNSDGSLVIVDGMREKKMSGLADFAVRMYGLMFFHFLGGSNYSFAEIGTWLKSAGFRKVARKEMFRSGFTMIRAQR